MVKSAERRQREERALKRRLRKFKWRNRGRPWMPEHPGKYRKGFPPHSLSCRCEYCMSLEKRKLVEEYADEWGEIDDDDG